MRILVVGAGAIGGYFGGRLLEAGCDVTFLLRPRRATQIAATGLMIRSPCGDVTLAAPHLLSDEIAGAYDLVILACKAYDLDQAIAAFAPAVGPNTAILPLLNGMRHVDALVARFSEANVLGGHCMISAALDESGAIVHFNEALHLLVFGERTGQPSVRASAIAETFARANFTTQASTEIVQEMWEKWVFIASMGCINSLMRASIGDIVSAGASDLSVGLYEEACKIARLNGFTPREPSVTRGMSILTAADSLLTASLLKDVESGGQTEAEHIVGDLIARGGDDVHPRALLRIAYANLRAYEIRRARS